MQFAVGHSKLFVVSWQFAHPAEHLNCCVRAAKDVDLYLWAALMQKKEQSSMTETQVGSMSWCPAPLPIRLQFSGAD